MCDKNPVQQEVENFNKKVLKKATTEEKNPLPTQAQIDAEKKAMEEKS